MLNKLIRLAAPALGAVLFSSTLSLAPASAHEVISTSNSSNQRIVIRVDISEQRMTVIQGGERLYSWPVSTARAGKITPRGTYQPQWFSKYHRSSKYNNAPMPHSVFYSGDYAIHGTDAIGNLGTPASAGCVRLHPDNAAVLYEMVYRTGKDDTFIVVQD